MGIFGRSGPSEPSDPSDPADLRRRMVETQIEPRGVSDPRVLEALREVPRHRFAGGHGPREAYADRALPIGRGQTISQPYIVALMTEALEPAPGLEVLEVGTGSGYQAAVLAACGTRVWTVERIGELQEEARRRIEEAGYADRVLFRVGDGAEGWPEEAPFDRVIVTAAAEEVPPALRDQLAPGGLLVAPVGGRAFQRIVRLRKPEADAGGGWEREELESARFVPLVTGE